MPKSEAQGKEADKRHPPGYQTATAAEIPDMKSCCPRSKKKGDRGFIEGCIFALCCCWLCEECCF
ncbi:hypothetical protein AQUCO_01400658v1 [Aquilegia coerulea]|uniref:Cysteine-rich transmembrane domain-containing protein n=1 Tax=Aquilegia coerulea TaxID=218851 RepID=A0A2G5DXI3_AQUCA|nr:hypothetical protein AQUCO_01400658v1 [Aquilegia coerulea]